MGVDDSGLRQDPSDLTADGLADLQAPANVRAILRVGNEFFLRSVSGMARLLNDDLLMAVVYTAMWTANVKHITSSAANVTFGGMDQIPSDEMRRPVSVMALANSLRIPYETARRTVQALSAAGFCRRMGKNGLIVPAEVHGRQDARGVIEAGLPSLLRFMTDLKRAGFDFTPYRKTLSNTVPLPPAGGMPANARALLRACSELIMRGIDTMGQVHDDDFLAGLIFTAIWTANVAHITGGADNVKFGNLLDLPPDEIRRPVTVTAISSSLRIPNETVRRYAGKLVRSGAAIRIEGKGLVIPRAQLAQSDSYEGVRHVYRHIVRAVADLHRAGFDFRNY
jgi:hypothetical protein